MLGITRDTKRLIILSIVGLVLLVTGVFVYIADRPEPTCFDGKENQDEEGTDCGGVCGVACLVPVTGDALEVKHVEWVADADGRFDAVAEIVNPNATVGAKSFAYMLALRDSAGRELARERGTGWILPRETKSLLAFGLSAGTTPAKATLEIENVEWESLAGFQEKPKLNVYDRRYQRITSGVGFGEVTGTVINDSPFDFQSIRIKVMLRDANGRVLALNQNEMRTLTVKEARDFRLVWPTAFSGEVTRVDVEADADVFHTDNFIKRYLPGGQYQDLRAPRPF